MAQKKQQDTIIDTIKENYVSAIVGLIIVILGFGYIYNTVKNKNNTAKNEPAQEVMQEEASKNDTITGRTYKVQKGDTLWLIAEKKYKSGYNFSDIVKANKLKDQNNIEVGQVLTLPDVPAKKITVGKVTPTVVEPTAKTPTVTAPTVTKAVSPTITLASTMTPKPSATVAPTAKPSMQPTKAVMKDEKVTDKKVATTINTDTYTVQKGDNLWSIAVRAYGDGYKWSEIWKTNKKVVTNPNLIFPGQKLTLPRK